MKTASKIDIYEIDNDEQKHLPTTMVACDYCGGLKIVWVLKATN